MRISVSRSRAGASAFAVSNRSSASVHGPSFGRGWTSRSYENAVSPDRRIRRTVLRDRCRVREISLIDFPLPRCSRRIRPIVSTISIPHRPLRAKAGSRPNRKSGGQFWTPMTPLRGSILHAETQVQEQRQVGNDNCVSYRTLKLQIPESPRRPHFGKARVKVLLYPDGSHAVFHGPRCIGRYDGKGAIRDAKNALKSARRRARGNVDNAKALVSRPAEL